MSRILSLLMLCSVLVLPAGTAGVACAGETAAWSKEKANEWAKAKPWLVGANFGPSTAINQLEMWQADSFDLTTIDRELGWAEELGFNSMRVFLHNLLWEQDQKGFLDRMEKFLATADKHGIGTVFVLLDGCWDPFPKLGKQRDPRPHVHNSGWVQAPGADILKDPAQHARIEAAYIKKVTGAGAKADKGDKPGVR